MRLVDDPFSRGEEQSYDRPAAMMQIGQERRCIHEWSGITALEQFRRERLLVRPQAFQEFLDAFDPDVRLLREEARQYGVRAKEFKQTAGIHLGDETEI